jgi:hypothetical protein
MRRLGRRGIARPAAKTFAAIGSVTAVMFSMATFAPAASAKPAGVTYSLSVILSGKSLHHSYTKAGSGKLHSEALTQPDDITEVGGDLFTGFQNGVGPQGQASTDGNRDCTVVEFTLSGSVVNQWDVRGKCDGLTANPVTGIVFATVNEDANSSLWAIDPVANQVTHYSYSKLPHDGGTDAISFWNGLMLVSASAPGTTGAAAPKPYYPAVYVVTLNPVSHVATTKALFFDESHATAVDGPHAGHPVKLGLTDPDSNEVVPAFAPRFGGFFVLDSQGDLEQIYVHDPGASHQHLYVLSLSQSVDDTAWATTTDGAFYVTDHSADTVNVIRGFFTPGSTILTVATPCGSNSAPATCPAPGFPKNFVGSLNMFTGKVSPVSLTGPSIQPQGMIFVPL